MSTIDDLIGAKPKDTPTNDEQLHRYYPDGESLAPITRAVLLEAFEELGGAARLAEWANADGKNLTKFYQFLFAQGQRGGPVGRPKRGATAGAGPKVVVK